MTGVVISGEDGYRVVDSDLDDHMVPKKPTEVTADLLHDLGRGIAYTRPAFAYLFTRQR